MAAEITFVTDNIDKLRIANTIGKPFDIAFKQRGLDIDEIQAEEAEAIVRDKANKAYALVGEPIIVNDDSWLIHGLNGFPGPYMKSIAYWLSAEDFLHLTAPLTDRRVVLAQYTVYQNQNGQQFFRQDIEGLLLPEIRGSHASPMMTLVSFDSGASSVAERFARGETAISQRQTTYHDLCEWYNKIHAN